MLKVAKASYKNFKKVFDRKSVKFDVCLGWFNSLLSYAKRLASSKKTPIDLFFFFQEFITSHYKEESSNYRDEVADFADMRTAVRTPSRNDDGIKLLLEYYNQLHFIENRFFPPGKPPPVFFHW